MNYLDKIEIDNKNNLSDSTVLIRVFDNISNGFINNSIVNGSTILFRNVFEMIRTNTKYSYGTHGTPTTNDLCAAISMFKHSNKTIIICFELMVLTILFYEYLNQMIMHWQWTLFIIHWRRFINCS